MMPHVEKPFSAWTDSTKGDKRCSTVSRYRFFLTARPISCLRLPGFIPEKSLRLDLVPIEIGKGFRCSCRIQQVCSERTCHVNN